MAGSLMHMVGKDGHLTFEFLEDGTGDKIEALIDCYNIIAALLATADDPAAALRHACEAAKTSVPNVLPVHTDWELVEYSSSGIITGIPTHGYRRR